MTTTRLSDWRSIVSRTDPDRQENNLRPIEYEFTAPKGAGKPDIHLNGMRVFRGYYQTPGPYAT